MRTTLTVLIAFVLGCSGPEPHQQQVAAPAAPSQGMTITSPAFANDQPIPAKYTCNGANISPPLVFSGVPQAARGLALVMTDPDAPGGTFTHWLVWDIPTTVTKVDEDTAPPGVQGTNDFGSVGYGGPCPPSGEHRYVFDLYPLDVTLSVAASAGRADLESAIKGHVLAQARLVGRVRK